MKEVKMEVSLYMEYNLTKKDEFGGCFFEEKPIDTFFGIGEGRVYVRR